MVKREPPQLGVPLAIASGGHLLLLLLLVLHFSWHSFEPTPLAGELLDAPTIDISEVRQIQRNAKKRKQDVRQAELAQQDKEKELQRIKELEAEAERQQLAEKQRLAEEQAREEVRRKADEATRIALEKKKEKEEREQKAKVAAEKKRKAEEEKQRKADEERKKKDAEAKKKREAEEQKRQAEAEKQRKEAEAKRRAQQEVDLEAQMEAEAEAAAARAQVVASEVQKYQQLIARKLQNNWIPANPTGTCTVKFRMMPGGMLLDEERIAGYGDQAQCMSARTAIKMSQPLPVPTTDNPNYQAIFDVIRDVNLTMDPTKQ